MASEKVERYVAQYGESCRQLIFNALLWLAITEPEWGLDTPIDTDKFITELLNRRKANGRKTNEDSNLPC